MHPPATKLKIECAKETGKRKISVRRISVSFFHVQQAQRPRISHTLHPETTKRGTGTNSTKTVCVHSLILGARHSEICIQIQCDIMCL
jgi:hypothetical protein